MEEQKDNKKKTPTHEAPVIVQLRFGLTQMLSESSSNHSPPVIKKHKEPQHISEEVP